MQDLTLHILYNRAMGSLKSAAVIAAKLKEIAAGRPDIAALYLFGSVARGAAGTLSDIDIAVLFSLEPSDEGLMREGELSAACSRLLGTNKVDLVNLNQAPVLLAHRVLRDGNLVFCRDDPARIRFHTETILKYLDTKPLRETLAKYLHERIKENRFAS